MKFHREGNQLVPKKMTPENLDVLVRKASRPADLARVWREVKPGYVRPLALKQLGQLRHFISACGGAPTAARAMISAVEGWSTFSARCAADVGAYKIPAQPHLGFLLMNAEIAMNMLVVEEEPVQVAAPPPRPKVEDRREEMDEAERAAYLAMLQEDE